MRRPNRDTAVFTTSAVDLFASALGAFILLVMLLFPFYRNAGDATAHSRTLDVMEQRALAAGDVAQLLQRRESLIDAVEQAESGNLESERRLQRARERLQALRDLPEIPRAAQTEPEDPAIEPDIPAPVASDEFSLLGIATAAKSFVIVIDMSGSMLSYSRLMIDSVLEVLDPLDATNHIAVVGYQGDPSPVLWAFPDRTSMLQATPENLRDIRAFVRGLARNFAGSTPTHAALMAAMQYRPDAIILMSDGAPDNNPNFIVQDISSQNRFTEFEIHTVAIGDYTEDRTLVMFLQSLAQRNGGDFVGVSR
ncbi:vWA domain-containing protein [Elongatibacter sediminis]|uniref:VWA domain-containing protein n=1 Tax=Elongatibacter sediminis TaxID=3119006 RepID=A0AAW9R9N4_9GAMM